VLREIERDGEREVRNFPRYLSAFGETGMVLEVPYESYIG